jgi:hypothetical protein
MLGEGDREAVAVGVREGVLLRVREVLGDSVMEADRDGVFVTVRVAGGDCRQVPTDAIPISYDAVTLLPTQLLQVST